MELIGNDKRIQALFRELKVEDERTAPGFVMVWNRAQSTTPQPLRAFRNSFALVSLLLVITFGSLAVWSRNWRTEQQVDQGLTRHAVTVGVTPISVAPPSKSEQPVADRSKDRIRLVNRARKLAAERQAAINARNIAMRQAITISNWQPPTAKLMQSPASDVLTAWPQLNGSVTEMRSFLPNTQFSPNRQ